MEQINKVLLLWKQTRDKEKKIVECFDEETHSIFKKEEKYFDKPRNLPEERLNHLPKWESK